MSAIEIYAPTYLHAQMSNFSPLHRAIFDHHSVSAVEHVLLAHPHLLNDQSNYFQNTPLHAAIISLDLTVAQFLVKCGANLSLENMCGASPLVQAIMCIGQIPLWFIQYLLDHGADANDAVPKYIAYCANHFCKNDILALSDMLIEHGATIDSRILEEALSAECDLPIIEALLARGAAFSQHHLFILAMRQFTKEVAEKILLLMQKAGIDLTAVSTEYNNSNALEIATIYGARDCVAALVKFVPVTSKALSWCLQTTDLKSFKLLLAHAPNANMPDKNGNTLLMQTECLGYLSRKLAVAEIVKLKPNVYLKNNNGQTIFDKLANQKHCSIKLMLFDLCWKQGVEMHTEMTRLEQENAALNEENTHLKYMPSEGFLKAKYEFEELALFQ